MRIDKFLADKYSSRSKAAAAISDGLVLVNGKTVSPSYEVKDSDELTFLKAEKNFVSAGGFKLDKALDDFGRSVEGGVFADIGASTGGFTDCLLQRGAAKVYCVDVGESQLDNFNARNLEKSTFPEELDGVTVDVSFISLTYVLGAVAQTLGEGKPVYALVKPQFECESRSVGKNGVVKDKVLHKKILRKIYDFCLSVGLAPVGLTNAPIIKGKNLEYVILAERGGVCKPFEKLIQSVVL